MAKLASSAPRSAFLVHMFRFIVLSCRREVSVVNPCEASPRMVLNHQPERVNVRLSKFNGHEPCAIARRLIRIAPHQKQLVSFHYQPESVNVRLSKFNGHEPGANARRLIRIAPHQKQLVSFHYQPERVSVRFSSNTNQNRARSGILMYRF